MDVISMRDFNREQILAVLDAADDVKRAIHQPAYMDEFERKYGRTISELLNGFSVFMAFGENSTRTNFSFRGAAQKAGAHVEGFPSKNYTSLMKGETWADTFAMIQGWGYDAIVMRSTVEGLPRWTKEFLTRNHELMDQQHALIGKSYNYRVPMILNGGDGTHDHPTQGFQDLYTMREIARAHGQDLDGLELALLNDLKHGRTNASLISVAHLFDMSLHFAHPKRFGPREYQIADLDRKRVKYVDYGEDFEAAMAAAFIAYHSRPQIERVGKGEDLITIAKLGRIDAALYDRLGDNAPYLMHPKPVDMETFEEIASDLIFHPKNITNLQASNGLYVRISMLALGLGRMVSDVDFSLNREYEDISIVEIPFKPESEKDPRDFPAGYIREDGAVIDHIPAGLGRRLYGVLGFEGQKICAPFVPHLPVPDGREPEKDMIKVRQTYEFSLEQLTAIALLAPNATISYIQNGLIARKFRPQLGNYVQGRVQCRNENCVTNSRKEHVTPLHWIEQDDELVLICNYCDVLTTIPEIYQENRFIYLK